MCTVHENIKLVKKCFFYYWELNLDMTIFWTIKVKNKLILTLQLKLHTEIIITGLHSADAAHSFPETKWHWAKKFSACIKVRTGTSDSHNILRNVYTNII